MIDIHYLSVDPGEKVGLAAYDSNAQLQWLVVKKHTELKSFLEDFKDQIKVILMEDYAVYPHKTDAHTWNKLTTVRVIGRVTEWAEENGIELHLQAPRHYKTGFSYLGEKVPPRSNPLSHALVAHAHFTYWGVRKKIIDPKDLV